MEKIERELLSSLTRALDDRDLGQTRRVLVEIYVDYRFLLVSVASGRLPNRQDAFDAAEEAFLRFMNAIERNRPKNLKAYLCAIADHVALEMAESKKEEQVEEESAFGFVLSDPAVSQDLKKALENLTQEQKRAVVYRAVLGLSFREIGKLLGISGIAADSLYRRAIRNMKSELGEAYED